MQGENHAAAGLLQEARLSQSAQVGAATRTSSPHFSRNLKQSLWFPEEIKALHWMRDELEMCSTLT